MTRTQRKAAAQGYIYRIRNTDKREYAIRYFNYLVGFTHEPEPANLSTMAAQAVRMTLYDICYPKEA
jgi:hypothetical protein